MAGGTGAPYWERSANIRASTMKITTGTPTVPTTPIGSRAKIFVSSHVSRQILRIIRGLSSVTNSVAGQSEEHILQRRHLAAKVDDMYPMLGQAPDDMGDELL